MVLSHPGKSPLLLEVIADLVLFQSPNPGIRSQALIQNIDYAPTLLAAAGLAIPPDIQGRSLLPVLKNEGVAPADWRNKQPIIHPHAHSRFSCTQWAMAIRRPTPAGPVTPVSTDA